MKKKKLASLVLGTALMSGNIALAENTQGKCGAGKCGGNKKNSKMTGMSSGEMNGMSSSGTNGMSGMSGMSNGEVNGMSGMSGMSNGEVNGMSSSGMGAMDGKCGANK